MSNKAYTEIVCFEPRSSLRDVGGKILATIGEMEAFVEADGLGLADDPHEKFKIETYLTGGHGYFSGFALLRMFSARISAWGPDEDEGAKSTARGWVGDSSSCWA